MKETKTILICGSGLGKSFLAQCIAGAPAYLNKTVTIVCAGSDRDALSAIAIHRGVVDLLIVTAGHLVDVPSCSFDQTIFVSCGQLFVQRPAAA